MKKNKKKLPRFWLGTRKPTSLGYQPNYGIGTGQFTSVRGEDITPEARAMQQNIVPGALSKLAQHSSPALQMFQNTYSPAAISAANAAANAALSNAGSNLSSSMMGISEISKAVNNVKNIGQSGAATAAKGAASTAGTALGILGSAYGLTDIGFQIANAGSHRTAADMRNTLTTNTYTTAGGNQYTEKGGVDIGAELAYERANTAAKQTNLIASSAGTGASIGGVIGTVVPGIGNLIGTVGGGLIGGAIGGVASLLGFGDNEDEMLAEAKLTNDVSSMGNRQRRSDASNLDVYNSFYNRSKNGPVSAANGKLPGCKLGKGVARLSGGEVVQLGPIKVEVPGRKNNKDEYIARKGTLLGEMMDDPRSIVYTNKGGISDYIKDGGDEYIALEAMKNIQDKYKNGKLPGYRLGIGDYALSTIPHFYQFLDSAQQYNTDRNGAVYVPDITSDYSGAKQIASQMIGDQEDIRPYLDQSLNSYKQALWNMQRTPGIGLGGRLLGSTVLFRDKLAQDAKTRLAVAEANRSQRNAGRQILANTNTHEADINNQNAWHRYQMWQQANAARDLAMRTDRKNMLDAIGGGAADIFRNVQYDRAQDYKERLMKLYENKQWLDLQQWLKDNGGETNTTTKKYPAGYISLLPSWQRGLAMQNLLSAPKLKLDDPFTYKPKNTWLPTYTLNTWR